MRLLTRLLLQVVLPFLVGAVLVLLVIGHQLEKHLRAEILDAARYTLTLRAQAIENLLNGDRRVLRVLASSDINSENDFPRVLKLFPQWKKNIPEAEDLLLFTLDGKSYRSPVDSYDVSDRPYQQQLRAGQSIIATVAESRITGLPVVLLTEPIFNRQGRLIGAIGFTVTIKHITTWVRTLKQKSGGVAILVDNKDNILVGHPEENISPGKALDTQQAPHTGNILRGLKNIPASTRGIKTAIQSEWQVLQRPIGDLGWQLAIAFPEKELYGLVYKIWEIGAWIIFAFTLGSVFVVYLFNRSLLQPIRRLATAQQSLENGSLTDRINDTSPDELGQLSRSFDRMANRLDAAMQNAHEAEEKFRTLFENANDAIFLLDGNRFIDCNPYTLELFECSREELLANGPLDFSPLYQADGRSTETAGKAYIAAALNGEPQFFSWRHISCQGRQFTAEVKLKSVEISGRTLLEAIVRDVSQREANEAKTRSLEAKFQRIFAASVDYMIVARLRDGLIIEANEGFSRLTGYPPEAAVGHSTLELNLWADPGQRDSLVRELEANGRVQDYPMRMRRFDGSLREVSVSVAAFELEGELHYVSIARDVTEEKNLQRALQASEARLKTIIDATPTPVCINRLADLTYISVNPAWEELYGLSNEQVIGKTITECNITIQNPARLKAQTRQLLLKGHIDGLEAEFITPQGYRVAVVYSSRIIELDGERAMISMNTDISRLKETEKRLKAIIESAPAIIVINRLSDFTYLEVNPEFERLFGRSNDEVRGKTIEDVGFTIVDPLTLRQQTKTLLTEGRIDNAQAEFITHQGRHISIIYSSCITELDGEPVMLSMSADISHIKEVEAGLRQAQAALKESEERFVALFQSSPIALSVSLLAPEGYLLSELNAAWYRSFSYLPEEVLGKSTLAIGLWADSQQQADMAERIQEAGEIHEYEAWLRRKDGATILCNISGQRIVAGGHTLLLAAYVDITEKRRIEQEIRDLNTSLETRILQRTHELQQAQAELMRSEKLAALGSLVAGVAHELNTPIGTSLTVASTLAERTQTLATLLANGIRRSELESYLADASSGAGILSRNLQRAAELIQSFKSIAVDQASDQRRDFDLRQIVDETVTALRPSLKKKPYVVTNEVEAGLQMNSYAGSLEQIIVNLINNAILHGFEERDAGTIKILGEALGSEHVRLSICDDGCGIAAAHLSRIFDPFFTTKLGKGGSGLGLHIVRNIVSDILGGQIRVKSSVGQGTTMILDLPRRAPDLQPSLGNSGPDKD